MQHLRSSLLESVGQLLMPPGLGWAATAWCQGVWAIYSGTLLFALGSNLSPQSTPLTAETCLTPVRWSEECVWFIFLLWLWWLSTGLLDRYPWTALVAHLVTPFSFLSFSALAPAVLCRDLPPDKQHILNYFLPICASFGMFLFIFGISVTIV